MKRDQLKFRRVGRRLTSQFAEFQLERNLVKKSLLNQSNKKLGKK